MKLLLNAVSIHHLCIIGSNAIFSAQGWGKLCQTVDRTATEFIDSVRRLHRLLENPELEVLDIARMTRRIDRVTYRHVQFPDTPRKLTPATNNVTIAVYVTSQARLRLFDIIHEAIGKGHRLLYCDTGAELLFFLKGGNFIWLMC
jgi:hypothetical protein